MVILEMAIEMKIAANVALIIQKMNDLWSNACACIMTKYESSIPNVCARM